jgi:hypothetical protein
MAKRTPCTSCKKIYTTSSKIPPWCKACELQYAGKRRVLEGEAMLHQAAEYRKKHYGEVKA